MPGNDSPALVWGGCGFIGRHLVPRLLAAGRDVSVLVRRGVDPKPSWAGRVRWFELPRCGHDAEVFAAALEGTRLVFNLAGSSGAVSSNRDLAASLDAICGVQLEFLKACARMASPPHVVLASSRLVYGRLRALPVSEDHPVAPLSAYAVHKYCVERYHAIFADQGALTYTACRISNPFGWDGAARHKGYGVINGFIERALLGLPITVFGDGAQLRDYLYITDLVDGLIRCGSSPAARNQVFNIGRGTGISLLDAVAVIREATGVRIEHAPWPSEYQRVESGSYVADVTRAKDLLAFQCSHDFRTGLLTLLDAAAEHRKVGRPGAR